jgi:hypothetical protein
MLAVVLIMTGCPQATLKDGNGREKFISMLKQSIASTNPEVIFEKKKKKKNRPREQAN